MTARPETRYTKTEDGYVGYQVFGEGPPDIVFITHWNTNLDVMWEEPSLARYFDRLASFARVICYDHRGTGISDPVPLNALPTLEQWMDDTRAVMDAVGSEQAALIGDEEGGPMAMLFAATYPGRVTALALVNTFGRWLRADDYPIGMPASTADKLVRVFEPAWGTGAILDLTAPSVAGDSRFREWFARYQRLSVAPGASTRIFRWLLELDVRSVLGNIQAPTLVVHRKDARHHRVAFGRYLAEHIPSAKFVELPGADTYPFHVDADGVLDEIEEFLTGVRRLPEHDRVLATVLFTDIVASTERAAKVGDRDWLDLRKAHDEVIRSHLERFRGREIMTTGDGFLATFDGPARAVRCAVGVAEAIQRLGIEIRAGLHTGEVEFLDGDIGGIAVHIAARVMAAASGGGVLVSQTVKDLVVGSGIAFADRGAQALKGVPGEWQLYEVTGVG
jgi:class 3 adenylate cyclase